jgi:hypothetical protein
MWIDAPRVDDLWIGFAITHIRFTQTGSPLTDLTRGRRVRAVRSVLGYVSGASLVSSFGK